MNPWSSEDGIRSPGAGVSSSCEPPDVGVGNSGPLEEQQAFLTTEPSVHFGTYISNTFPTLSFTSFGTII